MQEYEADGSFNGSGEWVPDRHWDTAKEFIYDLTNADPLRRGNMLQQIDYGLISTFNNATYSFIDETWYGTHDRVDTHFAYATLSNPDIRNKPSNIQIKDMSGTKLRETQMVYDGPTGRVLQEKLWRDTDNTYITNTMGYDAYGNLDTQTSPIGITVTTTYDSTYHAYPITKQNSGSLLFVSHVTYDAKSGSVLTTTDEKGLKTLNVYDVFFRLSEAFVGKQFNIAPNTAIDTPQEKKTYSYGGIVGGISHNS
ncbi:MAG: hypothetical protein AAFY56_11420, partial [Pseudomonadota bacterium]